MAGYSFVIGSGVALTPGAPKTVIMFAPGANVACRLVEFGIGFDGTTAANTPVLLELVSCTLATQGSRTIAVPQQTYGDSTATNIFSGFVNYTGEPTVETTMKEWLLTPNGGLIIIQSPLGRETINPVSTAVQKAVGLRCTAQQSVNVRGYFEISEGGS
jgi:hypothetical protein